MVFFIKCNNVTKVIKREERSDTSSNDSNSNKRHFYSKTALKFLPVLIQETFPFYNKKDYYITFGSKVLDFDAEFLQKISENCTLVLNKRIRGGKGGFGSLLKARKKLKKIPKNNDFCRDDGTA